MSDTSPAPKPFGLFERMLALRYLGATRKGAGVSLITIIAFLGIMLSVATLIVVMSVMQGFRITLLDQLLGVNGHVFLQPAGNTLPEDDEFLSRLEGIDGVTMAVPVLKVEAYAVNGDEGQAPVYIQGVAPENISQISEVSGERSLRQGTWDAYGETDDGIALAWGVASKLNAQAGDYVTFVIARPRNTPFGTQPTTQKSYRVDAIFQIGNYEFDQLLVYMPLEQAQLFSGKSGQITEVEMRVETPIEVDRYLPEIREAAGPGVYVFDWRRRFQSFFNALGVERGLMRIILSMIIAIATLLIFSGLVMLVKDKNSDIAVLRTVGASSGAVMRVFLMTGGLIGVTGAFSGVVLGTLIATNIGPIEGFLSDRLGIELFPADIYYLEEIPAIFEPGEVIAVLAFTLAMSLLFSAIPAWRASRIDPVEALRYE